VSDPLHLSRRQLFQRVAALGLSSAAALIGDGCTSPQPTGKKLSLIGVLSHTSNPSVLEPFRQGLRELGYVPGENITVEYRYTMGDRGSVPALVTELVALNPDVIVAPGDAAVVAKKASNTIPIVAFVLDDPVAVGLVASLARPGGNVTGFIYYDAGDTHTSAKRLELLKQALPTALRVAGLGSPSNYAPAAQTGWWKQTEDAAQALGIQLVPVMTIGGADLDRAFETALTEHADALIVAPEATLFSYSAKVADLALRKHLPTMFPERQYVDAGGLLSYGPSFPDMLRRVAGYVDRILRGAKPADLPVERPSKFDFVINLRTAAALGLTIPQSVLAQATDVLR
jgi:putative ABC transport system substrate-binding protein